MGASVAGHSLVTLFPAMKVRIGVLVFQGAEELDYVGPWEVFAMSREHLARAGGHDEIDLLLLAVTMEPVTSARGMVVLPQATLDDAPPLDILLVPGGRGVRREMRDESVLAQLRRVAEPCRFVTSVCTGVALLCAAGLADGRRVTTHWTYLDTLRAEGRCEVVDSVRFVQDGRIVTAAGVAAGIDMSLWLVGELFGPQHARDVRRWIDYEPEPPY
jgi:transcriptional regulator GlxA family with amidase domain